MPRRQPRNADSAAAKTKPPWRLDPALIAAVREEAERQNRTQAAVADDALRQYLRLPANDPSR